MDTYGNNPFDELENAPQPPAATEEPARPAAPVTPAEPAVEAQPEAAAEAPAQRPPVQPEQPSGQPAQEHAAQTGTGANQSPFANSPYVNVGPGWRPHNTSAYQQTGQSNNGGYYQANSGYQYGTYSNQMPYMRKEPQSRAEPVKKEKKKSRGVLKAILSGVLVVALVAGSCWLTAAGVNRHWQEQNAVLSQSFNERIDVLKQQLEEHSAIGSGSQATPGTGMTPAQVYAKNLKSVVAISNQAVTSNIYGQISETASAGSGFILSEDGYIVSNFHVVEGATTLSVILHDGTEHEAKYIGGDAFNDIALLKIDAAGLQAVTLGSSDGLIVGDQVVAIGNPLGELTSTLTVGYVSAKDRIVSTDGTQINMMQTDAAINPGNSGGPLFNMKGEVVGITTAKYSGTTTSGASIEGIGFAIPIDDVSGMLDDLRQYGYITGAYLGVEVSNMDANEAEKYGFPMGAYVRRVTAGSCAAEAGIRPRDIIVNLGGYDIKNLNDLTRALRKFKEGETITVTVFRSGREVALRITLDGKPTPTDQEQPSADPTNGSSLPNNGSAEDWFDHFFGGVG